ncbi:MAG: coenzyme F420 hydrogenase [Thermoplasmata archaeon]|nr:MAG: coenzyme F420 hydrogenase [Thermoplasmata archaeon]
MNDIPRIGGEARLVSTGSATLFITTAPVRGFEKMVEGKSPSFVIQAVMRICGICHASHAIAACEAFEHAFGIYPPRNGLIMREAIGLLNRIQSHLLHNIMILPDILDDYGNALNITIKMLEMVNKLLTKHAGAPTHPNKIVIGGIAKEANENLIEGSREEIAKLGELVKELKEMELNEEKWSKIAKEAKEIEVSKKFLATHPFYGDRYAINTDLIKTISYNEIHGEEEAKKSSSMVAVYGNEFVEVGPRARLKIYKNFDFNGIIGLQIARIKEIELAIKRINEILQQIEIGQPFRTEIFMMGSGEGIGVYEAPRGILMHRAKIDGDGRVESYKIVVPTMFNIPIMEKTGSEFGIRLFDPCIPCATHCIEVK